MILATIAALMIASCQTVHNIDSIWQRDFNTAIEIVDTYHGLQSQIEKEDRILQTRNECYYIWHSGEYMFKCRGKNRDIELLPAHAAELRLDDPAVAAFMAEFGEERFTDHYFTLQAMKHGESFDAARDGLTITVFFPIRAINHNDYSKLRKVFESNNDALHTAYLEKLKFSFENSGCSEELCSIRPLIEKNVAESKVKNEILSLYDRYDNIVPGKKAPTPPLKDTDGVEHTFAEFYGKILVIDVWATWCSSCLKKIPDFIGLKERYSDNNGIEFITVSIDRSEVKENWLAIIEKRNMTGMKNLFPDCHEESMFESQYHISGVPRYILIDKNGNIVTAYAPPPGQGLEELIEEQLESDRN